MYRRAIALVLVSGCWGAPKPTGPTTTGSHDAATGVIWATPSAPWHLRRTTFSLAARADAGLQGSEHGWVTRYDLKSGQVTHEKQLDPTLTISAIGALPDGRWLAIGKGDDSAMKVWTLDDRTLAASPVELPIETGPAAFGYPDLAVLSDGRVVITGPGLPLAVYDPKKGFALSETLDAEKGWGRPRAAGMTLLVDRGVKTLRMDVATKAKAYVTGRPQDLTETLLVSTNRKDGKPFAAVSDGSGAWTTLPEPVDTLAVGPNNTLVTAYKSELQVRALPSGEITKRIALGPSALGGGIGSIRRIDDKRLLVEAGGLLRVVDLATGVASPEGAAPWGRMNDVAVANDGTVLVTSAAFAWQLRQGKVVGTVPFDGRVHRTSALTRADQVVLIKDKHVDVVGFATPAPTATFDLEAEAYDAWFGKAGAVFDVLAEGGSSKAVLVKGGESSEFVTYSGDGTLWDVDVDAGEAVVTRGGNVGFAKHGEATEIKVRIPTCDDLAEAHLEHGGKRVVTAGDKELAVWDRTTGALIASAKLDSSVREMIFLAGRPELLVATDSMVGLWNPGGDLRAIKLPNVWRANVSPDGKRVVVSFTDSHVAVYDLAYLAGLPLAPAPAKATIPETCEGGDPFELGYGEDGWDGGEDGWDGE